LDGPCTSATIRQAIDAEATRLFLAARASEADADWDAAYRWIEQDPAHGYAFAKVEAGWALAARLRDAPPEQSVLATPPAPVSIATARQDVVPPVSRRRAMGGIAAALIATIGALAWRRGDRDGHYTTGIGERRAVTLADGSLMRLNTDTAVIVDLAPERRSIRLLRGEASFDVAHDTSRPFVVAADEARVRAVGTAFTVRLRPDLTEVTVSEGVVGVRDGGRTERPVAAGNAAAMRHGTIAVTPLAHGDIQRRLAWQDGRLSFDGDTLEQAVDEFNRYRTVPIVIGDPALAGIRIGGTFRSDRSGDFARALEQSFGIHAIEGADGSLLLVPAGDG
jgi:transmembrane sensor